MKKIISVMLCMCIVFLSFSVGAFAEEDNNSDGVYFDESGVTEEDPIRYDLIGIQPRWNYVSSATLDLSYSNPHAVCYVYISGYSTCTKITGDMILYRKDGSSYTKLVTWAGMTTTSSILSREREWAVLRGYTYKLVFTGTAYGLGSSEPIYIQRESTF